MHIICLTPVAPGVYNDHKAAHITAPPYGWAYIPDSFVLPSTFPRLGSLEAEERTYTREIRTETGPEIQEFTMMTVTHMSEGTMPDPKPERPSQLDKLEAQMAYTAMMTDTLLEV